MKDSEFLSWIWQRMVNVHGERSNVHYMLRLNGIILSMKDSDAESDISFEQPKPSTKTEFVKVGCEWNAWEYLKAFSELPDDVQWFVKVSDEQYAPIHDWFNVAETIRKHNLIYRKVETEIDERQEFIDAVCAINEKAHGERRQYLVESMYDSGMVKLSEQSK
ncbi:hypothetical protein VPHK71_0022 [Vibrio phage K71]